MVTKDEARWALVEATKEYVAAQKELKAMEITPEALIDKDLMVAIMPLTAAEARQRLERFNKAWTRYYNAWAALLGFVGT